MLVAWFLALEAAQVRAHDVMGTVFYVDLGTSRAHLEVQLPVDELRLALRAPPQTGDAALPGTPEELSAYLLQHLALKTPAGQAFSLRVQGVDTLRHDARTWLRVGVDAAPPPGASPRAFVLETDVIDHRVVSHRIFVFLRRDFEAGQYGDAAVLVGSLHYQRREILVERAAGSVWTGFRAAFQLGVLHIAEGSDHLVFLLTLLLPAGLRVEPRRRWVAGQRIGPAGVAVLRTVTAFTIGHSISLLLATVHLVQLPSSLVESLIAASIVVAAVHALVPIFPGGETLVGLGFGLIHGLGLASALDGLGVDGLSLLLGVSGFNLGVETMQALLLLLALPWLFLLQNTVVGLSASRALSAAALSLALVWLSQRLLGLDTAYLARPAALQSVASWLLGALGMSLT